MEPSGRNRWQPVANGVSAKTAKSSETVADEITLLTYPVVVGQGTRLFPATGPDTALELVDSRATHSGVTIQVYRPTGRPQYAT
jgi:dihydrofolate reductase